VERVSPGASWLEERAARSATRTAVECGDASLSYAELDRRASDCSAALRSVGVGRGSVVASLAGNGLAFVELLHAVDRCEAILQPCNLRLATPELAFQLEDSGAGWLVYDAERAEAAAAVSAQLPGLAAVPVDELEGADASRASAAGTPDADAPFAVLYTSGTTGAPKGAVLSRENLRASAIGSAFHMGSLPSDRWLACMPLFHVGGLSILVRCVLQGSTAVIHERFDPAAVDRALENDGITVVSLAPTMLERLLAVRDAQRAPQDLRCILLGGGPASPDLLARAKEAGLPVAPTYGLTEAASQVATRAVDDYVHPPGAGLVPLPGTEVRIVDDAGLEVAAGLDGEICVRGATVMLGYRGRPDATAEVLREGWLYTGDVGRLAADGTLTVLDRRSDLVISGGENVYPAEVEAVLLEHPAVIEAGVTSVPDTEYGARPAAWIVTVAPEPSARELEAFCRQRLASYKVPVAFHSTSELPRTASGKLVRHRLAAGE
jgi:O-succinylbenzoic acid--CoA ligase